MESREWTCNGLSRSPGLNVKYLEMLWGNGRLHNMIGKLYDHSFEGEKQGEVKGQMVVRVVKGCATVD